MIKTALIAAGLALAIPGLALAQTATSSHAGQSGGSRSMTQGDTGDLRAGTQQPGMAMSTGATRRTTHKRKKSHRRSRSGSMAE